MEKKLDKNGIDWETLPNITQFDVTYDKRSDTWFACSKDNRPAVSVDWANEMWIRIDPKTGEIIGIEIENFAKIFLKRHPEISKSKSIYIKPVAGMVKLEHCVA